MDFRELADNMIDKTVRTMVKAKVPHHVVPTALADTALMISIIRTGSSGAQALIAHIQARVEAMERGELGAECQEALRKCA